MVEKVRFGDTASVEYGFLSFLFFLSFYCGTARKRCVKGDENDEHIINLPQKRVCEMCEQPVDRQVVSGSRSQHTSMIFMDKVPPSTIVYAIVILYSCP